VNVAAIAPRDEPLAFDVGTCLKALQQDFDSANISFRQTH